MMPVRNIADIEKQIEETATQYDALSSLTTANAISLWRAVVSVFAFAAQYIEKLMDTFQTEMDNKIATQYIGSKQWYHELVRNYQHGDLFSVINGRIAYAEINDSKRIITHVNCSESNTPGQIIIKALKKNAQPLSQDENAGLQSYLNKAKIVGTHIILKSLPAEKIKLQLTIEIDNQVFTEAGNSIQDGTPTIKKILQDYLANLPFDDVFYLSKAVDHLQAVPGVKDVVITSAQTDTGQNIDRKYTPASGHLSLHEQSRITYVTY